MKYFLLITTLSLFFFCGCKKGNATSWHSSEDITYSPMLLTDLFYGMGTDTLGNYLFKDSVLDHIPGLLHLECTDVWYNNNDTLKYEASLGVYIDSIYPSETVRNKVTEAIDTTIFSDISYYLDNYDTNNVKLSWKKYYTYSPNQTLTQWNQFFSNITNTLKPIVPEEKYHNIPEMRVCGVAHRIFQDPTYVTYLVQSSIDYNGSCGCPSSSAYYTYNIKTGKILSKKQVMAKIGKETLFKKLAASYKLDAKQRGDDLNYYYQGNELYKKADGVALTQNGYLFYYVPYNLGCGADGEFLLFVQ